MKLNDWSRRWRVRGHWRLVTTNDGTKKVWVREHIQGRHEDKPGSNR